MAAVIVKGGKGGTLRVLGMPLRFLCDAEDTDGAWSLMEEGIPVGLGPPRHRHDWNHGLLCDRRGARLRDGREARAHRT